MTDELGNSGWPERAEKVLVIAMLEYLLDKRVLKVESIEGTDEYFPVLEGMIKNYRKMKDTEFRSWLEYWAKGIHGNHITRLPDNRNYEDCTNEFCIAAQQTIQELS